MKIDAEQRAAWAKSTKNSPFNRWIRRAVTGSDDSLDLERLHALARDYGIDPAAYWDRNPGHQRMIIGNRLRSLVPIDVYATEPTPAEEVVNAQAPEIAPSDVESQFEFVRSASVPTLLRIHAAAIDELRRREIVRTMNSPLGDYAEYLHAVAFGWTLASNSASGHDAIDAAGTRYQIKARRVTGAGRAQRQLSFIRNLQEAKFEMLAGVIFDARYEVLRAALIPYRAIVERSAPVPHVNGWRFTLTDDVWAVPGVIDTTEQLRKASKLESPLPAGREMIRHSVL